MSGTFNPENGTVNKYSADVMVPAFLDAYTGSSSLDIFPSIFKMLPNWSINYKGLSNLPWVRDHFKSVNLTHAYKSIYAVGSYHSYSSWVECMGTGGLGFIQNTTSGGYIPNSLFDVSTVSINESFSPLIGINTTLIIFNLIPIPPLDGSHVAQNLLSKYVPYKAWAFLNQYGRYILLAMLWLGVLSYPISWVLTGVIFILETSR